MYPSMLVMYKLSRDTVVFVVSCSIFR